MSESNASAGKPPIARILVVDDQKNMRTTTAMVLQQEGYEVLEAESGAMALEMLLAERFDVVLTDLKMDGLDGFAVLRGALDISAQTQVIVMTGYGTVENAVSAMHLGACDYLPKPFQHSELLVRIQRACQRRRLEVDNTLLRDEFRERYKLDALVGRSEKMRELLAKLVRAAATDVTVLINGESGTGKELIARAIHANSKRAERPFVPINCAAIAETLLESELFGHEKGAFTGAQRQRRGLLEEASGGTFFFDEIGETTPAFQAKLLRVLQEQEVRPVGGNATVPVDVRVVAATNQDLRRAIAERRFREDLFYRLNVVPLTPPPLRERPEDIPLLAQHFVERFNKREKTRRMLLQGALVKLAKYDFPGNVRELENVVEQAAALSRSDTIGAEDIYLEPRAPEARAPRTLARVVEEAEIRAIEASLARHRGALEVTAEELAVSPTTLWRKMKKLGIQRD